MSIDKLIDLNAKMGSLLKEYREAKIYENCTHHLCDYGGPKHRFLFVEIATKKELYEGTAHEIVKYCKLHGIDLNKVYNNKPLLEYINQPKTNGNEKGITYRYPR